MFQTQILQLTAWAIRGWVLRPTSPRACTQGVSAADSGLGEALPATGITHPSH